MKVLSSNYKNYNPSFSAMKAHDFKGADYVCMRKLKNVPIEQFNSRADFINWSIEKIKEYCHPSFSMPARTAEVTQTRKLLINQWIKELLTHTSEFPIPFSLVMIKDIIKNLKPNNDAYPMVFNFKAAKATLAELATKEKDPYVDASKIYSKHLLNMFLDKSNNGQKRWHVMKSLTHDPVNYENNATKVQLLSHHTWCSANATAKTHLIYGDIHILEEKNSPRVAIRFMDDVIDEIQSVGNKGIIPEDLGVVVDYISKNKFKVSESIQKQIDKLSSAKNF